MKRPSFQRRILQTTTLFLGGLLVGLVLAEAGLRIFGISYPVFDTYDGHRAIALKSRKEGWYYGEGGAYLKINSLGYRDIEHTKEKPPGVFRIAVLGDSFAEARQVDLANTFWKRLETLLQNRPEFDNRTIEVLNFGVGGYGTAQEFLTLKLHVFGFSPDVVLLAFCPGNDLADNSKRLSSQVGKSFRPYYVLRDGHLVLDNSFRDFSLENLYRRFLLSSIHYSRILEVINQMRRVAGLRQLQQLPARSHEVGLFDEEFLKPKEEVWNEAWAVTEAIIAEMNNEVLRTDARFVLVTLTTPIQVDPDIAKREQFQRALGVSDLFYTERRLRQLGERLGFPVIALAKELQEAASQQRVYFHGFTNTGFGSGHWNERGHELVADILARELPRRIQQSRSSKLR